MTPDMEEDGNTSCSDFEAALDAEFQAWRRSWLQSLIDDYGELSRYRAANAALTPPAAKEKRIVFFGDSITEGWRLDEHFPGEPYINRGISAQTTPQMLLRFRQDAIALEPSAVVILAGTNDIGGNCGPMLMDDIQANIASMAEIAQANKVRVILSSLLPPAHTKTPASRFSLLKHPPQTILELNRWLENYSVSRGFTYLDYFAAMIDGAGFIEADFSEDGLHPSAAGYRVMSRVAQAGIGGALES
jgi:lysophospholipase L1-like esterase